MVNIYIGIDPSVNSSGITCLAYDDNVKIKEFFFIVQPKRITKSGAVLTKKEDEAEKKHIDKFAYILYDKLENNEDNHINEYNKTMNFMKILNIIYEEVSKFINSFGKLSNIYVCQEGISYGSAARTKSVFDLAGLNFLLRNMVITKLNPTNFIIATPSEIKKKTTGNGNCQKDMMINLFQKIYPDFILPKIDDISDSFWMANYVKYMHDENLI